ncbi:12029_t:CDS:2, partial [Racocetra fulgida]
MIFGDYGALIFVIDAQDDYIEALNRLHHTVTRAYKVNPELSFEVFIHKVDALSDEYKIDTQRDIQQRITDELADHDLEHVHLNFYLTSIYDHSIFEAFSKVIQKLIPQLPTDESYDDQSQVDTNGYSGNYETANDASSLIKLNNGTILCLRGGPLSIIPVTDCDIFFYTHTLFIKTRFLALVCLLRADNFEKHGLIDYNFQCFKEAIAEVFELKRRNAERAKHERMGLIENVDDN